jgi:CheY-like chemotaxis protein
LVLILWGLKRLQAPLHRLRPLSAKNKQIMNATTPAGYVLLADDDQDDIEMLTSALKDAEKSLEVVVVENGRGVLEQLKKTHEQSPAPPPCVLVMDMNMPKMDGRETVVAIKGNEAFKNMPVVLFSTSKNRTDELFAEKWGVQYFQKPDTIQGLDAVAKTIISICRKEQ